MNNNFDHDPSTSQCQPPYEKPSPSVTTYLVLSIVGLALSTVLGMPLAGLIVSIIAMKKGKEYFSCGGAEQGEARAAKIMSLLGLIFGIIGVVVAALAIIGVFLYFIFVFGFAFLFAAAGM